VGGYCQSPRTTTSPVASCGHSSMLTVDGFEAICRTPLCSGSQLLQTRYIKSGQINLVYTLINVVGSPSAEFSRCVFFAEP